MRMGREGWSFIGGYESGDAKSTPEKVCLMISILLTADIRHTILHI